MRSRVVVARNVVPAIVILAAGVFPPGVAAQEPASPLIMCTGTYRVSVDPDGGTATWYQYTTGHTAAFTVTNNSDPNCPATFSLTKTTTGPISGVSLDKTSTGLLQPGGHTTVTATYNVDGPGSGRLTLTASGAGTSDNGYYTITVNGPHYTVSVTPDGGSQNATGGTYGNVATFTVTNQGDQGTLTYDLSIVGCTSPLTNCTSDASSVTVGQASSQPVTAHFDAQNTTNTGTITLRATHTASGTYDNGSINVSVIAHTFDIDPNGSVITEPQNTPGLSQSFTSSGLIDGQGYLNTVHCTGQVTSCVSTVHSPFIYQDGMTFPVTFTTTGRGSGTLSFTVTSGLGGADSGWYNVTVIETVPPTTSLIAPTGDVSVQYPTITIGWCDNATLNASSRSIYVNGTDKTSSFNYDTGGGPACTAHAASTTTTVPLNLGSNSVQVHICDADGNCVTNTYYITRRDATAPTIALLSPTTVFTASAQVQVRWCDNESLNSGSRWIKVNNSTVSSDYVTGGSDCAVEATSTTISVSLNPGPNPVDAYICDNWSNCTTQHDTVTRVLPPGVTLVNHNRDNLDRSLCLAVAAGDAGAVQCGDLILYHAMPAVRTLNKVRSLTLVYNSATADPRPRVAAQVTLGTGEQPTTVLAKLTISGATRDSASYTPWTPGASRQIVLGFDADSFATGVYPFSFLVHLVYTGGPRDTTIGDTLIVVNRKTSDFGRGWYLAGVEQLFTGQPANAILWVGGDGSAKVYRSLGSGKWLAPAGEFRDTIVQVGSTYERHGQHRATVAFDGGGHQTSTTDRLGNVTTFKWPSGRLDSIVLPPASSKYKILYDGNGKLDRITDPGNRVLDATVSGGLLTQLTDPDTRSVSFGYDAKGRDTSRTDRRGAVTHYYYDRGLRVTRFTVPLSSQSDLAIDSLTNWDEQGLAMGNPIGNQPAALLSAVYTRINGPRTDVKDTTTFWVDRWGAPVTIDDALGQSDTITRGNATFPALVTRVRRPNGQILGASYDTRGNLYTITDSSTYLSGQYATTRYEWDQTWDFVTRIVPALGDSTVISYDASGNRLSQEDARGSSSRVTFDYYSTGLLYHMTLPGLTASVFQYDGMGNLWKATSPKGFVTTTVRDAMGRDTMTTAPVDTLQANFQRVRTVYDAMNRVFRSYTIGDAMNGFARESLTVENAYDPEGNVINTSRWSGPDPLGVGTIATGWTYDLANRPVKETAPGGLADSTVFDAAGNALRAITRRGDTLTMVYDALNRLSQRRTSPVTYTPRCLGIPTTSYQYWDPEGTPCYPKYPNDGNNYTIWADTARFNYDAVGNMTAAVNHDAIVRRGYFQNGLLKADTLRIRTVAGTDTATHTYVLQYGYDRDGRRVALKHPGNIAPVVSGQVKDSTKYAYDQLTGTLATVTDPLGDVYHYYYNVRNEVDSVGLPGTITDQFQYDSDGVLVHHQVRNGSQDPYKYSLAYLRWVKFLRDAQGRLLQTTADAAYGQQDTLTATYRALGPLVSGGTIEHGWNILGDPARIQITESASSDAFANLSATSSSTTVTGTSGPPWWQTSNPPTEYHRYTQGTGRLRATSNSYQTDTTLYDAAGNAEFSYQTQYEILNGNADLRDRANYYGADGILRASETRLLTDPSDLEGGFYYTTFEEYRYDALGRRVLTYARHFCPPEEPEGRNCRLDKVRRTVWDGQQELYEIQMPADSGKQFDPPGSAYTESDTAHVNIPIIVWGGEPIVDPGPLFGRVAYTNGLGLDRPLGVVRMGYADQTDTSGAVVQWRALGPFVLSPVWMPERGQVYVGVFAAGGLKQCATDAQGKRRCVYVGWPEQWLAYNRPSYDKATFWHGTLLFDKHDEAGTFFRRNRYYDPQAGRFTQEDPIGLAGGLNLYGFENGDPINFRDPFGLCWKDKEGNEDQNCRMLVTALRGVAKTVDTHGEPNQFASAADFYEGTNRKVEFVDPTDPELNQHRFNTDEDPTTRDMGRTLNKVIKIEYDLRAGDLMMTAGHEALVHGNEHWPYVGDLRAGPTNRALWSQLPGPLKLLAPYWSLNFPR